MPGNLATMIHRHGQAQPYRLALSVGADAVDYGGLARRGRAIAGWLLAAGGGKAGRVGVLAGRSVAAYAGVVGACWAGGTYVPLGLRWPEDRLCATLRQVGLDALLVDSEAAASLTPRLRRACPNAILLAEPDAVGTAGLPALGLLPDWPDLAPVAQPDAHIAYIIFTSGTTATPKGVQIELGAIWRHLAAIEEVYRFVPLSGDALYRMSYAKAVALYRPVLAACTKLPFKSAPIWLAQAP